MKSSFLTIPATIAALMLACATTIVAQDQNAQEYQAVRGIVVAFQRHPDPETILPLIKKKSANPQKHLMTLALAAHERSNIRAMALDLLSDFPDDVTVLDFLEARIADPDYAEQQYALHSYARGFYDRYPDRVRATLYRCSHEGSDKLVQASAAKLLKQAESGNLRKELPGDYRRFDQRSQ